MDKKTENKIKIANAAAALYHKDSRFTYEDLAGEAGLTAKTIRSHFPNRKEIFEFYYEGAFLTYRDLTEKMEDMESYSLAERLSHLLLTLLDLFHEQQGFVEKTYVRVIERQGSSTPFAKHLVREVNQILMDDVEMLHIPSFAYNKATDTAILYHVHGLMRFWVRDHSDANQKTMELIDKWTALAEAVAYSKVGEKSFDFAKFMATNSPFTEVVRKMRAGLKKQSMNRSC